MSPISFYKDRIISFLQLDKERIHTKKQGWRGRGLEANLTNKHRGQNPK